MRFRLYIDEQTVHAFDLDRAHPIGRAPSNLLALSPADLSSHHALLYPEGDAVWVKDLGSKNGTYVNEERITTPQKVGVGTTIRLGSRTRLVAESRYRPPREHWVLRSGPVSIPLYADSEHILSEGNHLKWDGSGWSLYFGERARSIETGFPFHHLGRQWVIEQNSQPAIPTERADPVLPYLLTVDLTENTAELRCTETDTRSFTKSGLRAGLLYALGERFLMDGPIEERGWMTDAELSRKVWGVMARKQQANNLNVLVHRVRQAASKAGLDKDFIEKRPGRTRLVLADVILTD